MIYIYLLTVQIDNTVTNTIEVNRVHDILPSLMRGRVGLQGMHSGKVKYGTVIASEQPVARQPKTYSVANHLKYSYLAAAQESGNEDT